MEVKSLESSKSGSSKVRVVDSEPVDTLSISEDVTTGPWPLGPEGQLLSQEPSSGTQPRDEIRTVQSYSGLTGNGRVNDKTLPQHLVLFDQESRSESGIESEWRLDDRFKTRVRKVSDVIDSLGLESGNSSPLYPNQRSPLYRYPSTSSQSSCSSKSPVNWTTHGQSGKGETTSSPVHYTRDEVGCRRQYDETDAQPPRQGENSENRVPPPSIQPILSDPLVEALMPAEPGDDEYNMGHHERGIAVIFNNDKFNSEHERSGSATDVTALREALSYLGFQVKEHNNLTRSEIGHELDQLENTDFSDNDCFCMVVLTHGEAPELLHAKDGVYRQTELWTPFIGEKCPTLAGKPKLFFIQACRGEGLDRGVRLVRFSANSSQTDACPRWSYVIPSWADFLIAHSSVEGFYSWRNPSCGTWWIQTLCEELKSRCSTHDLVKIMTIVHRRVALEFESFVLDRPDLSGCKEIPSFTSSLMRDVYFRPKPRGKSGF